MNSMQVELRNIYTFFLDDGFVSWQKMLILMYLENFLMKNIPYSSLNLHDLVIILVTIWNIQSTSYNFAKSIIVFVSDKHCVKSVRIQSFSAPYLVLMRENMGQKNSEYGHFSRSDGKAE